MNKDQAKRADLLQITDGTALSKNVEHLEGRTSKTLVIVEGDGKNKNLPPSPVKPPR